MLAGPRHCHYGSGLRCSLLLWQSLFRHYPLYLILIKVFLSIPGPECRTDHRIASGCLGVCKHIFQISHNPGVYLISVGINGFCSHFRNILLGHRIFGVYQFQIPLILFAFICQFQAIIFFLLFCLLAFFLGLLLCISLSGSFLLFCLYGIDCACDSHKQHQQKNPHPKVSLPDPPDISPVSGFVSSRARSVFCTFFRSLCV